MSKRRGATPENVRAWLKRGDGQGEGKDYRPFLHVRDVPSLGRSSMVLGLKTGRVHHYLSDLEYYHHILSEYEPSVLDIREQYALLPWEETQEIADELCIAHPRYPGTKTPIVMTSDIVLTFRRPESYCGAVISIKRSEALAPDQRQFHRTLEKLLIEKTYWERRGIPWCVSTEKHIPLVRAQNLNLLRTSIVARELDWLMSYMAEFTRSFECHWGISRRLIDILNAVSADLKLSAYYCQMLFGRMVWMRKLPVDLDSEIIHHQYPLIRRPIGEGEHPCLALA